MSLFKPSLVLDKFNNLDIISFKNKGFKAALIDIDNTITIPDTGLFTDEALEFVKILKDNGINPIIFSNNNSKRVKKFIGSEDIEYYYYALKPLPFRFWSIAKKHNYKPNEIIVLGDQLLTDILGANLSGCYGVYCKQLYEKDTLVTSFNRHIEKRIWKRIKDE